MANVEAQQALVLAQRWLESPPDMMGDPDCNECVLARQYVRALSVLTKLQANMRNVLKLYPELGGNGVRELADAPWPSLE